MDSFLYLIFGVAIGGAVGYLLSRTLSVTKTTFEGLQNNFTAAQRETFELKAEKDILISNLQNSKDQQIVLQKEVRDKNQEIIDLHAKVATLASENNAALEKLGNQKKDLEELQETTRLQFKEMAAKILDEKTEKFTHLNQEKLLQILNPFKENIAEFKKTVQDTYVKDSNERSTLKEQIKLLHDLNQKIGQDAQNLTQALKGESKTQGNWGEMILESILEGSGLQKDREYFLQYQLKDAAGNPLLSDSEGRKMYPDAVVKYPGDREVLIDSKVSLTAFVRMTEASTVDDYDRELQQHLASVKKHIDELSAKGYDDYKKSLDFVMMFIPSEPAYIAALQGDAHLWQYGYDKRVLLLSPTNLITSLKLIADLWKRENQNQNAQEIADRGAKLYDKFVGFIENLEKVGQNIDKAHKSYDLAFKQLTLGNDNLVRQAEKLRELGLKNKKDLPQRLTNASQTIDFHPDTKEVDDDH